MFNITYIILFNIHYKVAYFPQYNSYDVQKHYCVSTNFLALASQVPLAIFTFLAHVPG